MDTTIFDDIVEDEYGIWTQVCKKCAKKYSSFGSLDDIPIDSLICGVEGCSNEAEYYLDIADRGVYEE